MNFTELQLQIKKLEPSLSAEGLMLVGLFMPFCEALIKENAELKAKVKNQQFPIWQQKLAYGVKLSMKVA